MKTVAKNINSNQNQPGSMATVMALLLICLQSSARTEIDIQPFSEVPSGQAVKLGWIASPTVDGPSNFEKIEDLEILEAANSGERQFLGRVELARILRDKLELADEFSFKIPNQIVIQSKKIWFPNPKLQDSSSS